MFYFRGLLKWCSFQDVPDYGHVNSEVFLLSSFQNVKGKFRSISIKTFMIFSSLTCLQKELLIGLLNMSLHIKQERWQSGHG